MKTYRQREKQGTKVSDTSKGPDEAKIKVRIVQFKTDVDLFSARLVSFLYQVHNLKESQFFCDMVFNNQALLERTGYTLDVTTGQRKYGGPPPESVHSGAQPTIGTEVKIISLTIMLRFYASV